MIDTRDFSVIPVTETEDYQALLVDMRQRTFKELVRFYQRLIISDKEELRKNIFFPRKFDF